MTKARDLANASTALSAVSATELGYVDGVTSAIQTQMDGKIAKTLTTTTGDIIYASGANTPARLGIGSTDQVLKVTAGVPAWATPAASGLSAATQAEMETASSTSVAVTPGRQQYHPSASKFWVYFTGTGTPTIQVSYNMTSITDFGTGYYGVNIGTDFSSGNYALFGNCDKLSGASSNTTLTNVCFAGLYQVGDFGILTSTLDGTLVDSARVWCIGYGDQ